MHHVYVIYLLYTVDSSSLMVTFRLMARPARERNHSFFDKANIDVHCPTLRAKSVYSTLIVIINRLLLSHASSANRLAPSPRGVRVNRAPRGQCVMPCGGENNDRTHG